MAALIPALSSCLRRMQSGEKRFARRLEALLEDDYLCWYEMPVGTRMRYSDFILLHPSRGILLLEVKDWKLETIRSMDRVSATLLLNTGLKTVANPLEQVRQCTYQLVNRLAQDPQLRRDGGQHQGKLVFPWGYGVVLSNITRRQFDGTDLGEVLPAHLVICKDEMTEGMDAEAFQTRLWDMFNHPFPCRMTLPQIDRVRWHIHPEIRIGEGQLSLFDDSLPQQELEALLPDVLKVMDLQQEQLARSMGEGHRVIHGVAGSGKTLILGYRCLHLAQQLHKPILVLCYNVALAMRLRVLMEEKALLDRVQVYHFHDWCGEQIRRYHLPLAIPQTNPGEGDPAVTGAKDTGKRSNEPAGYFERMVEAVIRGVERQQVPTGQYGALMIDEGHDFQGEWLKLVVQMVDPESNSLLLLYDDAQSLYRRRQAMDFSLSSVGIQARGRTTILRLNYRNTNEILAFAYRFASQYLRAHGCDEDHVPLVEPTSAGRHGPAPALIRRHSLDDEIEVTLRQFHSLQQRGTRWGDMCVTYYANWIGERMEQRLLAAGIPVQLLLGKRKRDFRPGENSVKLMTMHSSKGLEFSVVAIVGVGYLPNPRSTPEADARLLYVAMTRSIDKLLMTYHQETAFTRQLDQLHSDAA